MPSNVVAVVLTMEEYADARKAERSVVMDGSARPSAATDRKAAGYRRAGNCP